jgi:hypothetical protein
VVFPGRLSATGRIPGERPALPEGVENVRDPGRVGGVVRLTALLWVTRVRLRRSEENAVEGGVAAARDLAD